MKRLFAVLVLLLLLCNQAFAINAEDFVVSDQVDDTDKYYFYARMLISDMTLEEKVAQLFVVPMDEWDAGMQAGGVMVTNKSIVSESQMKEDIAAMQAAAGEIPLFVIAEEEGGYVSRIAMKLGYEAAAPYGELAGNKDFDGAYDNAKHIGAYLENLGINVNLAPNAERKNNSAEDLIPMRYAGTDENTVAKLAVATVNGLKDAGIAAGIKYFDGSQIHVFAEGKNAGAGIVVVSESEMFSERVVETLLRDQAGFEGIVMTSALSESTVTAQYTSGEAAVKALQAGCDMLLLPKDYDAAFDAVMDAVKDGKIPEETITYCVQRIVAGKIIAGFIQ